MNEQKRLKSSLQSNDVVSRREVERKVVTFQEVRREESRESSDVDRVSRTGSES